MNTISPLPLVMHTRTIPFCIVIGLHTNVRCIHLFPYLWTTPPANDGSSHYCKMPSSYITMWSHNNLRWLLPLLSKDMHTWPAHIARAQHHFSHVTFSARYVLCSRVPNRRPAYYFAFVSSPLLIKPPLLITFSDFFQLHPFITTTFYSAHKSNLLR